MAEVSHLQTALQVVRMTGWRSLLGLGALMLVSSLTEGLGLLLLVPITAVIAGEAAPPGMAWLFGPLSRQPVAALLVAAVALVTFRAWIVYSVQRIQAALGLGLTRTVRVAAQDAIMSADWRWLSAQNSTVHAARIMGEADRVGTLGDTMLSSTTYLFNLVVLVAAAFAVSWRLTILALAAAALVALVLFALRNRRDRDGESFGDIYHALHQLTTNGLLHLRAARISGAQNQLREAFGKAALEVENAELRYQRSLAQAHVIFQACAAVMLGLLIYVALMIMRIPLGLLVPVLAIMVRIVPVATGLQQSLRRWQFNRPALADLRWMADEAARQREPSDDEAPPPHLRQALRLQGVSLTYAGRTSPVFENFDLTISAGSIVTIFGPSGVGKSSLADLLAGLIEPDCGQVLVDDENLRGPARIRWRRRVAYVEQSPYLFDGTIAENLAWGMADCSEERMRASLLRASADFVLDLPQGLTTRVGESGRQLSGGERQRLALARALLRAPDLLILDEVTAALDGGNEALVNGTIAALKGSCTILVLGHRTGLLEIADQVVDLGAQLCERPAVA